MRKKIVAGNWKMNNSLNRGIELASEINKILRKKEDHNVQVIIAPPMIHLSSISSIVDKDVLFVAAQNCASEPKGAFTGEVSARMIKSTGADFVIVGHSERRQYFGETNQILKKKIDLCLENSLTPIYCVGEILEQRNNGIHFDIIKSQIEEVLFDLPANLIGNVILAYEPVWAIGTGVTASPEQAQEIHAFIRSLIESRFGAEIAENISILYGGSCNPGNARELFSKKDVDGGLIGGAALKATDFIAIIESF